jgi:hypothetical protein
MVGVRASIEPTGMSEIKIMTDFCVSGERRHNKLADVFKMLIVSYFLK